MHLTKTETVGVICPQMVSLKFDKNLITCYWFILFTHLDRICRVEHYQDIMPKLHWSEYQVMANTVQWPKIAFDHIWRSAAILNQTTLTKSHRISFWGTNTQNLKSIDQSSTELWPKICFNHIWRSVGHLESDNLDKTTQLFILRYLI